MSKITKGQSTKSPKSVSSKAKGATVPPAKVQATKVAYDRTLINGLVALDREAGKTRLYPDFSRYQKAQSTAPDARIVLDNGDEVAQALRSVDLTELWKFAAHHLDKQTIAAKKVQYEGKNVGMVRMNVGNLIRGAIRRKAAIAALREAQSKQAKK